MAPVSEDHRATLPLIALTMGDAAGIGPEVVIKSLALSETTATFLPLIVGHPAVMQRAMTLVGCQLTLRVVESPTAARKVSADEIACWNPCREDVADVALGRVDARAGQAAFDCLVAAARAALRGELAAITTAPLNKAALFAAGLRFPGHTEILADVCGVTDFGMMLYLPAGDVVRSPQGLGVVHTTLHTSIRSVPELLSTDGIAEKIRLMDAFLRRVRCVHPRIAVCALNPHAGEDGLFGDEEARIIQPAVERCRSEGLQVSGPLPTDTLLRRAVYGEFDGVVAMYHDQGHIALKLIAFDRAVNVTLGLPIIRTSPSHGTAFDIAGRNIASADGMLGAIRVAALLATSRG